MSDKKISVIIVGNPDDEHSTYVQYKDKYFKFYTDGYEGNSYEEIARFLKFLGYEVFEIYNNNFKPSFDSILNQVY